MKDDRIDISVWMITYNHAKYIEEAIESALAQKCSKKVEIVIADDCSTDGTREILKLYAERYVGRIRVILNNLNLGPIRNAYESALNACRGEYLAPLEGDDYWIDRNKLQKQYDYLFARPSLSACFTDYFRLQDGEMIAIKAGIEGVELESRNVLMGGTPHTATLMIRRSMMPSTLPIQFYNADNSDTFLMYMLTKKGRIGYIKEPTSVYRINESGLYSGKECLKKYEMRKMTYKMILEIANEKSDKRILVKKIGGCIGKQIQYGSSMLSIIERVVEIVYHDISRGDIATVRLLKSIIVSFKNSMLRKRCAVLS